MVLVGNLKGALPWVRADDYSSLQAAVNACIAGGGGKVLLSAKTYTLTDTLSILGTPGGTPFSLQLIGGGGSGPQGNAIFPQFGPATKLQWAGPAGHPMIALQFLNGWGIEDLSLVGNSTASVGISGDRVTCGSVRNVGIKALDPATGIGLRLYQTSTDYAANSMHNIFSNLVITAPTGIKLEGNPAAAGNCCHNVFERIAITYGDSTNNSIGLVIANGDNNCFTQTYLYRQLGTGYAVELQANARANYFYHLQANGGGLIARTPAQPTFSNAIFGYDRENGEPAPILETGAHLDWTETGRFSTGWHVEKFVLPTGCQVLSGTGSPLNVVTAPVGSTYTRKDGGANTTLYVKESGSGSSGWVAK